MPMLFNPRKPSLGHPAHAGAPLTRNVRTLLYNKRANPLLLDPTRTTLLRRQFENEMRRRFKLLRRHVQQFLVEVDALGMKERPTIITMALPPKRAYEFLTDVDKLKAFNEWFKVQSEADVLRAVVGEWPTPLGSIASGPWTVKYIESAYRRGLLNAYLAAKKGITASEEEFLRTAFGQPELLSKIELLGTRSFELLRGVTAEMGAQMNRILAQGMADGKGVASIAREMVDQIDGMTEKRATLIARTEIIHAHAEGQLDGFEALGIEELNLVAEWTTVGDDRVCPACSAYQGTRYSVKQARGLIPLHPNCRCSWTMVEDTKKVRKADE